MNAFTRHRGALLAWLGTAVVFSAPAGAQSVKAVLDETWTVTINGQTVTPGPDGLFVVPNVSAADRFGPGGPGTGADGISDDALQLLATRTVNGVTEYAFSERFYIRLADPSYRIQELTITRVPPPSVGRLFLTATPGILTSRTQRGQIRTVALLNDSRMQDVTRRVDWTTYRTSNPAVARIDGDGVVTPLQDGTVFLTATNDGVAAVTRMQVAFGDPLTTVTGFALLPNGNAAAGAEVTVIGQGLSGTAEPDGRFEIPGVGTRQGELRVFARATVGGLGYTALSAPFAPVPGGKSDAGLVELQQGDSRVLVANLRAVGSALPSTVALVDLLRLEELDSVTLTVDAADADTTDDGRTAVLVSEQGQRLVLVDAAGPKLSFARDVALPFAPRDVDVTAHGFALVTAATQSTVASVDVATGTLVDSVGLTGVATAVAAHPNGDLALATSADGRVHAARIAADGKLTLLTPSVATGGASPSNVLFAPGGTFALVTHTSSNTVGVVDVDATGALTARAPVDIGAPSQSLTFHPAGDRAFVYNPRQGTVRVLVVDAGGNVSYPGVPITGLRTDGVANAGVDQIAATTDGRFVLVHEPNRCIVLDAMQPRILALLGHYDNLGAGGVTPLGR